MSQQTGEYVIPHGTYGSKTRYEVIQHKYAGGNEGAVGGYIEVLEIKNPPENKWPIIVYEWHTACFETASVFTEFKTLEDAISFFDLNWGHHTNGLHQLAKGFICYVKCHDRIPWFYAKNSDRVVSDFVVPPGELF